MLNTKCRTHGSDHPDMLCPRKDKVHQALILALANARDVIHRTHCPTPGFPKQCWKECEEAEDALLEADWMPLEPRPSE